MAMEVFIYIIDSWLVIKLLLPKEFVFVAA